MVGEPEPSTVDYYALLISVVSKLENNSAESRQALYDHARTVLIAQSCDRNRPPTPPLKIVYELGALSAAIYKIEDEASTSAHAKTQMPQVDKARARSRDAQRNGMPPSSSLTLEPAFS